jgi:hypothetical protein
MKKTILTLITALLISSNLSASLFSISVSGQIGDQDGDEAGSIITTNENYTLNILIDSSIAPTTGTYFYGNSILNATASVGSFSISSNTGAFDILNEAPFSSDEISLRPDEMKNEAQGISNGRFNYFFTSPDTTLSGDEISEALTALSDNDFTIRFETFEYTHDGTSFLYNLKNTDYEVSAIPEPSQASLLAIILFASLYFNRRRSNKSVRVNA